MTSLREIFKKGKLATKKTTDKVLDADLNKVGKTVAKASGEVTKALLLSGLLLLVILIFYFVLRWTYFEPKWCKDAFVNHFYNDAPKPFEKLQKWEKRSIEKNWSDFTCTSTIMSSKEYKHLQHIFNYSYFSKEFRR